MVTQSGVYQFDLVATAAGIAARQAAYTSGTSVSLATAMVSDARFDPTGNEIAITGANQKTYNIQGGGSVDGYATFVFWVPSADLPLTKYALWLFTEGNVLAYVASDGAAGDPILNLTAADADPNGNVPVIIRIALEDKPGLANFTFTTPTNIALDWSDTAHGMPRRATTAEFTAGTSNSLGVSVKQLKDFAADKNASWSDTEATVVRRATQADIDANSNDVAPSVRQVKNLVAAGIPSIRFGNTLPGSGNTINDVFVLSPSQAGLNTQILTGQSIYNEHATTTGFTYDAAAGKFVVIFEDSQNSDRLTALHYNTDLSFSSKEVLSQVNIGNIYRYSLAATATHYLVAHIIGNQVTFRSIRKSDKSLASFTLPSIGTSGHINVSIAWDGTNLFACDQISHTAAIIRKYSRDSGDTDYTNWTLVTSGTVTGLPQGGGHIEGMTADNGKVWLLTNKTSQTDAYIYAYTTALVLDDLSGFAVPTVTHNAVGLAYRNGNYYIVDWNSNANPDTAEVQRYPRVRTGFYTWDGTQWVEQLSL